jgi:tRNA nucleotidyltransferase (CCA-adding enzyme)
MQNKAKSIFWEHFPHEADMGIRGVGATKEQAFEQAAMALTAVITGPANVELKDKVEIACEAADDEMLLIEWLSSVIFEMDSHKMLFGRFEVHIEQQRLHGLCWGEKVDVEKHSPAVEVKGATYTALSVRQKDDRTWVAQCVVDV